jgi:hypothetical protein
MALMTTASDLEDLERAAGGAFVFEKTQPLPNSAERVLALARRTSVA